MKASMSDPDLRPDPDALLASLPPSRGRLKLFFGAAPGVGKTCAMLAEAAEKRAQGLDVLVGWVDTHGRAETEAMLATLPVLPRKPLSQRGKAVAEFDIDAVLARRPALVVVDELPHSNAAGSRHPKRWQDVEELLGAGIDVYSAMNVQHLDSLNDVVSTVTGVSVGETVPDHVFDHADEVRLVDLPPDDLLLRLAAGKIYLPEVAARAAANFFRKGNLIALRELALRRMADRVDGQMRAQRDVQCQAPVWATSIGVLLVIDGRDDERALRQAQRLARALSAPWHAVWVDGGDSRHRAGALAALAQAAEQGAHTLVLSGQKPAPLLAEYARRHNLSLLVLSPYLNRHLPWQPSLQQQLARHAPELGCLLLAAGDERGWRKPEWLTAPGRDGWWQTTLACALLTLAGLPLRSLLDGTNVVMCFLLVVLVVAVRYGRGPAAWAAVLGVALFDVFFVPPYLSFAVSDIQYLITFAVMLSVGLVAGQLVASQRQSAAHARQREAHTRYLYEMARELGSALLPEQVGEIASRFLHASLAASVGLWLPDADEQLAPQDQAQAADAALVRWCFDHQQAAGQGTHTLPDAAALYLPLQAPMRTRGVLVIHAAPLLLADPDNRRLCEAVAALTAQTLERLHYIEVAQQTLLSMESERLRHSLLAALSHDLRTPLTALSGTAETLLLALRRSVRPEQEQAQWLLEQTQRMTRLVTNLLEMARLQAGGLTLHRQWLPADEVWGGAIAALGDALAAHPLRVDIAADCPLLYADPVLLERLLVNLLENAVKYSAPGTAIGLSAAAENQRIVLRVQDGGPGLPPGDPARLFDAFSRGERESALAGVGLGLAICRTIADVHGASLSAANVAGGGACFTLSLPCYPPPAMDFDPEEVP